VPEEIQREETDSTDTRLGKGEFSGESFEGEEGGSEKRGNVRGEEKGKIRTQFQPGGGVFREGGEIEKKRGRKKDVKKKV